MTQIRVKCDSLQIFPEYNKVTFTPTRDEEVESDEFLKKFGIATTRPATPITLTLDKGDLSFVPGEEYFMKFDKADEV